MYYILENGEINLHQLMGGIVMKFLIYLITIIFLVLVFEKFLDPQLLGETGDFFCILVITLFAFWIYRQHSEKDQRLKNEINKYKSLVELSPNPVLVHRDGIILYLNKAGLQLVKPLTVDEVQYQSIFDFVEESNKSVVMQDFQKVNNGECLKLRKYKLLIPNGEVKYIEANSSRIIFEGEPAIQTAVYDITEREMLLKKLHESEQRYKDLAFHDMLTGLPNRLKFNQELMKRIVDNEPFAILFVDLDRFKPINDTLGHDSGDMLLQIVAQRLLDTVRQEDMVMRLGGDEFTIMIRGACRDVAEKLSSRIIETLSAPYSLGLNEVVVTASLGISLYPYNSVSPEELLKQADIAMYHAKTSGKNQFCFFTPNLKLEVNKKALLEQKLRKAVRSMDFTLAVQPRYHLKSETIVGGEALIRWKEASPSEFIPIAEETGLINDIGEWMLKEMIRKAAEWNNKTKRDLCFSVNLSIHQLRSPTLDTQISRIINENGGNASHLELEITESMLMEDGNTVETLQRLRNMGVKISIDDFGTGYSSFGRLRNLPIDKLKMDRLFVKDIGHDLINDQIVRTIVQLGHNLGLQVVAEGVEKKEQLDFLKKCSCDEVQGFYTGKPMTTDQFEAFLD